VSADVREKLSELQASESDLQKGRYTMRKQLQASQSELEMVRAAAAEAEGDQLTMSKQLHALEGELDNMRIAMEDKAGLKGPSYPAQFKRGVGFGIEVVVSKPVRPIRSVHFECPADRLAETPTGLRFLSKHILGFEQIIGARPLRH